MGCDAAIHERLATPADRREAWLAVRNDPADPTTSKKLSANQKAPR
jgi:hypothetical protein